MFGNSTPDENITLLDVIVVSSVLSYFSSVSYCSGENGHEKRFPIQVTFM